MKIVIVGAGFAGVRASLLLANRKDIDVKLISDRSYFEYHAALYRSATGRSPLEVVIPLNEFFDYAKNVEIIEDSIATIDAEAKEVSGESGAVYGYDSLILALGNVTEYYGVDGLKEHAFGVKTIHEALKLKRHLHEQLINTEADKDYVVIGAGATGVELSAELTSYLKKIRKRHGVKRKFDVNLIEAGPLPLPSLPEDVSTAVAKRLNKLKVKTHFNTSVMSETVDAIQLQQGSIKSQTVIWTAGVANNPIFSGHPEIFKLAKGGKVEVDEYLQAVSDIYVVGDSAATEYSGMAQTALGDAAFVVDNLIRKKHGRKLRRYVPKRPIYAVPVGARWAAVLWGNTRIYGRLGWLLRRLADLHLYLTFLTLRKALTTWRYGFVDEEICPICKH